MSGSRPTDLTSHWQVSWLSPNKRPEMKSPHWQPYRDPSCSWVLFLYLCLIKLDCFAHPPLSARLILRLRETRTSLSRFKAACRTCREVFLGTAMVWVSIYNQQQLTRCVREQTLRRFQPQPSNYPATRAMSFPCPSAQIAGCRANKCCRFNPLNLGVVWDSATVTGTK